MSQDPSRIAVPDVVGFDAVDAVEIVRAAGLVPHGPQFGPAPSAGTIVAQEPAPDVTVETAATVVLWTENRRAAGDRVPDPIGSVGAEPT